MLAPLHPERPSSPDLLAKQDMLQFLHWKHIPSGKEGYYIYNEEALMLLREQNRHSFTERGNPGYYILYYMINLWNNENWTYRVVDEIPDNLPQNISVVKK